MKLEDMDALNRKLLMNDLIEYGWSQLLEIEHDVTIPSVIFIQYRCSDCTEYTQAKFFKADLGGLSEYVKCPECRAMAYPSTIAVKSKTKKISQDYWSEFF